MLKRDRRVVVALLIGALALLFSPGRAPAQCCCCRSAMQPQYPTQLYALLATWQQQYAQPAARRPPQRQSAPAARPQAVSMSAGEKAVPEPQDPNEVAAGKLKVARMLAADADKVHRGGEKDSAARMRARASERLQDLIAKYPGTQAADEARELLDQLSR